LYKENTADAIKELKRGNPVLIYDSPSRENETDIAVASQFITPDKIRMMRKDGGGLICTTVSYNAAVALGLDYLVNIYKKSGLDVLGLLEPSDIKYENRIPTFSITINHRHTYTGISDNDRAFTISEFSKIVAKAESGEDSVKDEFGSKFRSPGHVSLLISSKLLLEERFGHTELSTYLAYAAGIVPTVTIVEMLSDNGTSLPKCDAEKYAKGHGLVFIEGKEIKNFYKKYA
jgi:3,4-dihydroxy 2-butanone 4-phosphate synthase